MVFRSSLLALAVAAGVFPAGAGAATLPPGLQARLEENALSCSYQLFATKGYGRLESEPSFLKEVRGRFDQNVSSVRVLSTGTALSSAAAVGLVLRFAQPWNAVGPMGLGGAVSSGAASLSLGAKAESMSKKKADFDRNDLNVYAGKTAQSLARVMALDAVRENALRSEIIRRTLEKIETKDNSDLELFTLLKEAKYSGKPLLTDRERETLDEIFNRSNDPATPKETSNEDKVKFLAACKEAVKLQLPKVSGRDKEAAEKVTNDTDRFQRDLDAYIELHPEAKELATPKPRTRPVGGSLNTDSATSMSVE
jgi:hypothetical protein